MFAVHVASASSGTGTFPKDAVDRIGDVIDAAAWAGVEPGVILAKNLTNGPAQLWDAATARCMAIEAIRRRLQKAAAEGKPVEADLTWWNLEYPPDAADQPAAATIEKGTHE